MHLLNGVGMSVWLPWELSGVGRKAQPMLKSRCGRFGLCLIPGCHMHHSLFPLGEPGQVWSWTLTLQSPAQWRSLRSETQLDANRCCQVSLGPPSQSFPALGWKPWRGSRGGVPVAPPAQTLGILHPSLCWWLLCLFWLSWSSPKGRRAGGRAAEDLQLCIPQGGPWLLFMAGWGAPEGRVGGGQGGGLRGSGKCCTSEHMGTWQGSCIAFIESTVQGRQLGDEKGQPNLPLENPQGWRPRAVNHHRWGLCICPFLPRREAWRWGALLLPACQLGVVKVCGSSSSLWVWGCPGLCGHLSGPFSFAAGRGGSWPWSVRGLETSTPLSWLRAEGVRVDAACSWSQRPGCSVGAWPMGNAEEDNP